jgi:putative membrane protein
MKVSRSVEYSYAVFGKYLKMIAYDSKYSKFFLGVPGILLLIGGIASVFGFTGEIFAVLISILGGAFLIRAFDIDKAWTSWTKPTPAGLIRSFTMITGGIIVLTSIPSGIASVNVNLIPVDATLLVIISNQILIGQFVAGALPFWWIGLGAIFGGILLSNWMKGSLRAITDVLRIVVLIALYPTIFQFSNILIHDESPFTLILPLLAGLGVTLISVTLHFRKYRKKKGGEVLSE